MLQVRSSSNGAASSTSSLCNVPDWDTIRRQIRTQENALDASLGELSKLAAKASNAYSSQGALETSVKVSYGAAEEEIRTGLTKVRAGVLLLQMPLGVSDRWYLVDASLNPCIRSFFL